MMLKRIVLLFMVAIFFVYGCDSLPTLDEVIPDRRKEYRKSEALPDLEVPPDLTTEAMNDPMAIPNEEATTLSEYQKRKGLQSGGSVNSTGVNPVGDEQWLTLQGSTEAIWPSLSEFWLSRGYKLELNDKDLGVMETGWLETSNQGISSFRDKFSIIAENAANDTTVIYISSQRQEKIDSASEQTNWVDIQKNTDFEKQIINEMNLFFYGANVPVNATSLTAASTSSTTTTVATTTSTPARPKAEIHELGDDKIYLSLPDEFTRAWDKAENAILSSGMQIKHNDREKGLYFVMYYPEGEKKSLFSKLKFWSNDADSHLFQLSLTGVGDKTEMVVLDNEGDWVPKDDAQRILTYIQVNYNNAQR